VTLTVVLLVAFSIVLDVIGQLCCKVILGEHVSRRRWLGTLVITLGVMLVCIAST